MIKKLVAVFGEKEKVAAEDVTSLWNMAHAHLRPIKAYLSEQQTTVPVFADVRFGNAWIEAVALQFDLLTDKVWLPANERQRLIALVGEATVQEVNARLWFATPTIINIEPTTRCNFNCWYCVGRHMDQADIELDNFAAMLDNAQGLKTVALVGEGEPLLHKDFFKMAAMARARGMRVMIISNGSAFSQSVIEQLCMNEVAYVSISIDSYDAATFASSRIDGSLDKVLKGIRRLRNYRDEHGYQYPKIALKGTLFKDTQGQLPEIVRLAKAHGVEIFESFQALNPMSNYIRIYPERKRAELEVVDQVRSAIDRDSVAANKSLESFQQFCDSEGFDFFPSVRTNPLGRGCNETWLYSLLSGDVTPCCQIKNAIDADWNVFNNRVVDVLSNKYYEQVRFNLWNGIFPDYCRGCWKTRV